MTTTHLGTLQDQIERLVREHLAASRRAVAAAVERAFGSATGGSQKRTREVPAKSGEGRRRPPEEVADLGERLYRAICANPGAVMSTLAAHVGATPRELNRPALLLRRAGRVRSVGQRQATRYFPMAAKAERS
jgi:hypothetical protein